MARKGSKKKNLPEMVMKRRMNREKKKINPFDLHVNKVKQQVLGREIKGSRGFPLAARTKAEERYKNTLLQEYKNRNKNNVFNDHRIGEKNPTMSLEEKAQARYTAEMMKAYKKRNIYNLDDSVVLTHRGQTLEEIEKFEDPRSDDDDDDDDSNNRGQLDKKFVSSAHFGGGIFSESNNNNHKDVLAELILQSKQQKYEKQKTREDTIKKTEELDATWKDLLPLIVGASKSVANDEKEEKTKADDYDIAVNQLKFESRGKASDPLKSEEEIKRKEKEELEKYERERLKRMNGFAEEGNGKHRSADALDDDFDIQDIVEEEEEEEDTLAYDKDGVMVGAKWADGNKSDDNEIEEENSESDGEEEEKDEDEEEDEEDSNAEESEEEDNFSDVKEFDSSSDEKEEEEEESPAKIVAEEPVKVPEPMEKLTKSLKFYLQDIMSKGSKLNSKDKAVKFFKHLNTICPQLWDLVKQNPASAEATFQAILLEQHEKFENSIKKYPGWDTLILFKIVSLLFSTSDFRHPVVTPCLVFMSRILFQSRVKSKLDIFKGIFLTIMMLEYTAFSKKFSPGAINFLRGIIYLSTVKTPEATRYFIPPFKRSGNFSNLLVLGESKASTKIQLTGAHMLVDDYLPGKIDEEFKIRVFLTTLNILQICKQQLEHLDAAYALFEPIINLLKINNYDKYPKNIQQHVKKIIEELSSLKDKKLKYLVKDAKKVKALKLYEPKFDVVYDRKNHQPMSKEKAERAKLAHKIKREFKGAIRDIRKDSAHVAKIQIKEQIKSDETRKRKVKEIYGEGATQQGELNKLARMK